LKKKQGTMKPLHFAHQYTVSLVEWINRLLPTWEAVVCTQGVHLHSLLELGFSC
jgi:hypothetical protein